MLDFGHPRDSPALMCMDGIKAREVGVNQASAGGRPRRKRLAPVDVDRNAATGTLRLRF
jgi:hypothetical protein